MSVDPIGSPSKHALSRSSPQFLSYRRFCRERTSGLQSESSARLKVEDCFVSEIDMLRGSFKFTNAPAVIVATGNCDSHTDVTLVLSDAQVSSVDFRRIWLDKDTKEPSREGIGIWRAVPPPGYFALGAAVSVLTCIALRVLLSGGNFSSYASGNSETFSSTAIQVTLSPGASTLLTRPLSSRYAFRHVAAYTSLRRPAFELLTF